MLSALRLSEMSVKSAAESVIILLRCSSSVLTSFCTQLLSLGAASLHHLNFLLLWQCLKTVT